VIARHSIAGRWNIVTLALPTKKTQLVLQNLAFLPAGRIALSWFWVREKKKVSLLPLFFHDPLSGEIE